MSRRKGDNTRACGRQRRATGVLQAFGTVLYFSTFAASAGGVPAELRRGALYCVAESLPMETTRKSLRNRSGK